MIEMTCFQKFESVDDNTRYVVQFECDREGVVRLLELAKIEHAVLAHRYMINEEIAGDDND